MPKLFLCDYLSMKKNESSVFTGKIELRTIVIVGYDGIELLDATGLMVGLTSKLVYT